MRTKKPVNEETAANEETAGAAVKAGAIREAQLSAGGDKYATQIASLEGELREPRDKGVAREAANQDAADALAARVALDLAAAQVLPGTGAGFSYSSTVTSGQFL